MVNTYEEMPQSEQELVDLMEKLYEKQLQLKEGKAGVVREMARIEKKVDECRKRLGL